MLVEVLVLDAVREDVLVLLEVEVVVEVEDVVVDVLLVAVTLVEVAVVLVVMKEVVVIVEYPAGLSHTTRFLISQLASFHKLGLPRLKPWKRQRSTHSPPLILELGSPVAHEEYLTFSPVLHTV